MARPRPLEPGHLPSQPPVPIADVPMSGPTTTPVGPPLAVGQQVVLAVAPMRGWLADVTEVLPQHFRVRLRTPLSNSIVFPRSSYGTEVLGAR